MIVLEKGIQKEEKLMVYCDINDLVYPVEKKTIFWESFIKISEVNAHTSFTIFLRDHENIGQPFWVLHLLNKSSFEQLVYFFHNDLMSFFIKSMQFLSNQAPSSIHIQVVASYWEVNPL